MGINYSNRNADCYLAVGFVNGFGDANIAQPHFSRGFESRFAGLDCGGEAQQSIILSLSNVTKFSIILFLFGTSYLGRGTEKPLLSTDNNLEFNLH